MPYSPNTDDDRRAMLETIGAESIDELFSMIPEACRLRRPLDLPPAMGEWELTRHVEQLAARNLAAGQSACFLGAGCYDHFIPAVVDFVAARSEFYTSYTPYQPEVSQGNLQALFEYQTLIVQLTGMGVANSSLYDGATALAEAVLMALGATDRRRVVVPESVHPEYRRVLATYLANLDVELITLPVRDRGAMSVDRLNAAVDARTACVVVPQPNFFGCLEPAEAAAEIARRHDALTIALVDPLSLGVLRRPSDWGADIVAAEGQSLGIPMGFGGPYLGILACREPLVRRMPGRLVGQTVDRQGRRCFVLTLQTREQHIRREKATSNVCTNQALMALRAAVYLAVLGPAGLRAVGELCARKARYALDQAAARAGAKPVFDLPVFKEFAIRLPDADLPALESFVRRAAAGGVLPGVPLGRWYPELADCLLVAVTEKRTRGEIDRWVECLAQRA